MRFGRLAWARVEPKDKITIAVSVLALAVSIASPIATFYWLDPKIKEYRDKQIVYAFRDESSHFHLQLSPASKPTDFYHISFHVGLLNIGQLPVKDVVLAISPTLDADAHIIFNPPVKFSTRKESNEWYLSLDRSLGPHEMIQIQVSAELPANFTMEPFTDKELKALPVNEYCSDDDPCPPFVWVSSEHGAATPVPSIARRKPQ